MRQLDAAHRQPRRRRTLPRPRGGIHHRRRILGLRLRAGRVRCRSGGIRTDGLPERRCVPEQLWVRAAELARPFDVAWVHDALRGGWVWAQPLRSLGKQLLRRLQRLQPWLLRPLQPLRKPHGKLWLWVQFMGREPVHGQQLRLQPLCVQPLRLWVHRVQPLRVRRGRLWRVRRLRRGVRRVRQRMGLGRLHREQRGGGAAHADLVVDIHQLQRQRWTVVDQQGRRDSSDR